MNKIFKMNKIVLHPNLVNRVNRVNPVQSSFRPHAACSLNGQGGNPLNPLADLRVPSLENSVMAARRGTRSAGVSLAVITNVLPADLVPLP